MKNQQNNDESEVIAHPLLHDFKALEGQTSSSSCSIQKASFSGAVFNISTTMIGAGIMSIPATIKVLGIIPGFIAIVVVAVLTEVTVEFLLRYTNSGKSETYAGTVGESFGPLGSIAVQVCIIITNLGCLIIFFIIIGKLTKLFNVHVFILELLHYPLCLTKQGSPIPWLVSDRDVQLFSTGPKFN